MSNSFIEWKPTDFYSSQKGVQVSISEDKKVEVFCVERSLFSRIVDSIAHIFGSSSNYGIHLIPETSPIFLELSEDFNKEDIAEKILPQIRTFLSEETTSITKDSSSVVLEIIARKVNNLKEKIPFLEASEKKQSPLEFFEKEQIDYTLPNEKNIFSNLNIENEASSPIENIEEVHPEDDAILNARRLRNRAKHEVPPSKGFNLKNFFLVGGLVLLAGCWGSNAFQSTEAPNLKEGGNQPSPVYNPSLSPDNTTFSPENITASYQEPFIDPDVTNPPPEEGALLTEPDAPQLTNFDSVSMRLFLATGYNIAQHPYLKEMQAISSAGRNPETISTWQKQIIYEDGSIYNGETDMFSLPTSQRNQGELKDYNGNIIYKGYWNEGIQTDGFGTVLLDDQSLFTGPIRDGAPCGKGIKKSLYGQEEYIVSGYGKLPVENNQIFIGDIENHQASGYGELFSKDGTLIKEGIFHGNKLVKEIQTVSLPNSEFFRGEIDEKGLPDGYGVVYSEKGLFIGKFDHGELIGVRPEEKNSPVLLFSSYTSNRVDFNKEVINNHKLYAKEKGYHYVEFIENVAQDLEALATQEPSKTLPYWSKIAATIRLLTLLNPQKFPENVRKHLPQEFVWLDDDAVVTKRSIKIEDIVEHYAPQTSSTHVFLTQDPGFDLNTAILFVKNTVESRSVLGETWSRRLKKSNEETYATCANQSCFHEQAALQDLVKLQGYDAQKYVRIIPQRDPTDPAGGWGINTFNRESHYDEKRDRVLDYSTDAKEGRWQSGDFIGQATGMAQSGRLLNSQQTVDLRDLYARQLWLESK